MRVSYHPHATAELIKSAKFYDRKVHGLGDRFLTEFERAITTIAQAPGRWRIVQDDIRRFVMKNFPFALYYRIEGETIRVLVVKHHSRHPDYWKYRLK
jgi:hypothetical protein